MAGFFEELFGTGANFLGNLDYTNRLQGLADNMQQGTSALADQARQDTSFQPFTVTSGLGTNNVGSDGSLNIGLSPEQQAMQDQLLSQSSGFFNAAAGDTAGREADIYERIRAMQRPGEERASLSLENRLLGQGRLGISTDAYGGTPEQLAQEKAVAEARNTAGFQAIEQARAQQAQDASLGAQYQTAGYNPENQAINRMQPGQALAAEVGAGRREGANLGTQLELGGMTAATNYEQLIGDIIRQQYQTAGGLASGVGAGIDNSDLGTGFMDFLRGLF